MSEKEDEGHRCPWCKHWAPVHSLLLDHLDRCAVNPHATSA